MNPFIIRCLCYLTFLLVVGCSDTHTQNGSVSTNDALFDPANSVIPLPNILATATATDPLIGRAANKPMDPLTSLAYINWHEVGRTHAVSGLNSPIYIRFAGPLVAATVTGANIKVFQLTPDSASPSATENNPLGFTDISAMFSYQYTAGSTDVQIFPNFPLQPATRYAYLVTTGVKDAATGFPVATSTFFEPLKSTIPLVGILAPLEPIRANADATGHITTRTDNIALSGYAKLMNDAITDTAHTKITGRDQIALLGRFITTAAGFVPMDATNATATSIPVESAIRAFAAGSNLLAQGGLSGKTWTNAINNATTTPAGAYWTAAGLGTAPGTLASVTTGSINSAQISVDPVVVAANAGSSDLTAATGAYNPAAGVLQPFRAGAILTSYYHVPVKVPFIYLQPTASNGKLVIFQHGVTGKKEQVLALAQSLSAAGYSVVAIDLPLHNELAIPTHTTGDLWGQDFIALGAPLATRSNIQQAALNLNRLELTFRTGGFVPVAGAVGTGLAADIKFVGMSLGSIVGTYYLAGNTTLNPAAPAPYSQNTLNLDMKGFLSVPGGRLAYLLKDSPNFGPSIKQGLAANGITPGTPTYNQFFLLTQAVTDPVDPATMTTPLASILPSRLSGRIAVQEVTSTTFDSGGNPTNGDLVITNLYARYFGNALGGRGVLGAAGATVAPGFDQLAYLSGTVPAPFMFTLNGATPAPKVIPARAVDVAGATPAEGYFQFNQTGIEHGFLIDNAVPANTALAQTQLVAFLLKGVVVDPTSAPLGTPVAKPLAMVPSAATEIRLPAVLKIIGY